jgi:cleaved adhesin domain protein
MNKTLKPFVSIVGAIALSLQAGAIAPTPGPTADTPRKGSPISGSASLLIPGKGAKPNIGVRLGERNPLVPPFMEVFDDFSQGVEHAEFERHFEVIDANNDGRSWGLYNHSDDFYSKCAYLLYPLEDGNLSNIPGRDTADDWLVSRAIKLEGGKYYNVKLDASLFLDGTTHLFEVKMGEYNDVDGMEYTVIPTTEVSTKARKHVNGWFQAPGDGLYYIGIHAFSERSKCAPGYLFMDNIGIDAARTGGEPGEVSNVEFTNDPNGSTKLDIRFDLPSKDISGADLSGTVDVTVKRGDAVVGSFSGKTPGTQITFTDAVEEEGDVTYVFVVKNSVGEGREYKTSHYAGVVEPESPVITSISEESDGRVKLTWTAPKRDIKGSLINQDMIRYNIYDFSTEELVRIASNVEGTSYIADVPLLHGGQTAAMLIITATFNDLVSSPVASDMIIVGIPYKFPYSYSFVESMSDENVLSSFGDDNVSWRLLDDYSDPKSQDGDNGYISMIGTQPDQKGEFSTGKIDLTSAKRPYVSIYTYVYPDDENVVRVSVIDCATKQKTLVGTFNLKDYKRMGWNCLMASMADFAGKVVRVCFEGEIESHGYIPFDNLVISDLQEVDLSVDVLSYTRYAGENEDYEVVANVMNTGHKTVDKYDVKLICDGKCVDVVSVSNAPLQSMKTAAVTLSGRFSSVSSEMPNFYAEVVAEGDQDADNNRSNPFTITFLAPNHPAVNDLRADEQGNNVELTWSAPDLSKAAPEESFEDFESYAAFTTKLNGGWTMYDGDKGYVSGYGGLTMPVDMTQQAWWTMTNDSPFDFLPTLGKSSLVQMCSMDEQEVPVQNDDWIISPELYGGRQTVEFWARSARIDYGYETFEVYYSTTDNNRASFKQIMYETMLDEVWTQFYVSLPEGAKYFAIRCTSNDCFNMMLDNITYTAKGTPQAYELKGYNVYRNGIKLNDSLLTGCRFSTSRELESDSYFVTAVYDRGESVASNVVWLGDTGIDTVIGDNQMNAPVEYFDLQGIKVAAENLRPGLYLRRQGAVTTKIIIR